MILNVTASPGNSMLALSKTLVRSIIILFLLVQAVWCSGQTATELHQSGLQKLKDNDLAGAIKDYNKAIETDSTKGELFYSRGLVKARLKQYEEALKDFTKSYLLNQSSESLYMRALMKVELDNYQGALDDLNNCYEAKKTSANYFFIRGNCKYFLNNYEESVTDFTKAIELKADFASAYLFRGLSFISLEDKKLACPDFQKAKELNSPKAAVLIEKYCN